MQTESNREKDTEAGELYAEFKRLQPQFKDKESAIAATFAQLETIAASVNMTVEAYLREAHTTSNSTPQHSLALQLERQLGFLRR